jgi:DNA-binding Xre family transcriptional regulator
MTKKLKEKQKNRLSEFLKKFIFEKNTNISKLSEEIEIPNQTLHRLVHGKTQNPHQKSLEKISEYFCVSVEKLINDQDEGEISDEIITTHIHELPIVPWEHLKKGPPYESSCFELTPFVGEVSEFGFATIMPDASMEPIFNQDGMLIFDEPYSSIEDRSYILVHLSQHDTCVFRQLVVDTEKKHLKPLNRDLASGQLRVMDSDDKILGILIESRHAYRNKANHEKSI